MFQKIICLLIVLCTLGTATVSAETPTEKSEMAAFEKLKTRQEWLFSRIDLLVWTYASRARGQHSGAVEVLATRSIEQVDRYLLRITRTLTASDAGVQNQRRWTLLFALRHHIELQDSYVEASQLDHDRKSSVTQAYTQELTKISTAMDDCNPYTSSGSEPE